MYDLTITGGMVVDGTGGKPFRADLGIKDGVIVDVRRRSGDDSGLDGETAQSIDATGRIVTPGFVDIHTHYDGQVSWDGHPARRDDRRQRQLRRRIRTRRTGP